MQLVATCCDVALRGDVKRKGYRMVSSNFKVLAKFGHCLNCWLARARKIFVTARMLRFSIKFPYGKPEKHWGKPPGGGGHSLIWAIRGRAAGQGMAFWPRCPKQGIQFDLPLHYTGSEPVLNRV